MESYILSAAGGLARGVLVQIAINPLEVVQARCQRDLNLSVIQAAQSLWREEGVRGFYRGFGPDIRKRSYKVLWTWPLMTFCASTSLPLYPRLFAAGLAIALTDTLLTTGLEKRKLQQMAGRGEVQASLLQNRTAYGARLASAWCSFLIFQQFFRERAGISSGSASISQLALVGFQTAVMVSIVTAPFNFANTRTMTDGHALLESLRQLTVRRYVQIVPLNLSVLTIQNFASVTLIHLLGWK